MLVASYLFYRISELSDRCSECWGAQLDGLPPASRRGAFMRNLARIVAVNAPIMNHRLLRTFLLAASLGFITGCQTVESRIKEKPEAFAKADLATQEKITQGIIEIGFTEDQVYLALGKPDQKRETLNADGKTATWIYNTYYERPTGTVMAGYHRSVYYDPYLRAYRMYYRPVLADTYVQEKEERIRIVFQNGKATVIEQAKG